MKKEERVQLQDDLAGDLGGLAGVPLLGTGAKLVARALRTEWTRNRSVALRAAEETSGLTREDLCEQISEDPNLVPLLTRLLHAAGQNGHDRTLRAMGLAFGDAIRDRGRIDECEAILTSLADLGSTHVQVLELLAQSPPIEPDRESRFWSRDEIGSAAQLPASLVLLVPAALISRGLVEQPALEEIDGGSVISAYTGNDVRLEITDLGRLVLEVIQHWKAAAD